MPEKMNLIRGLIAAVRIVGAFEVPTCYDRRRGLNIVGPRGWIDQRYGRLRYMLYDGQSKHFDLIETPAVLAALINIGVASLDGEQPWASGSRMRPVLDAQE
jgi:hypothetical protein